MTRLDDGDGATDHEGLVFEWSDASQGSYSGRSTLHRRRPAAATSSPTGIVKPISVVLAAVAVVIGGYAFSNGLVPSGEQIRRETARQAAVAASIRNGSDTLSPATAPALAGVAVGSHRARPGIRFPAGAVDTRTTAPDGATLTSIDLVDATENGLSKVVRIKDLAGDRIWADVYLAPGGHATTDLPAGGYRVTVAEGGAWFGAEDQFRDDGRYYAPQALDVRGEGRIHIELPAAGTTAAQPRMSKDGF